MNRVLYKHCAILEGDGLALREDACLVVEDDRIVEIVDRCEDRGVDLQGCVLFPSFVDAHTHIADAGMKDEAVGLRTIDAVSPPNGLKYKYLAELSSQGLQDVLGTASDELLASGICAFADFREGAGDGARALQEGVSSKPLFVRAFGDALVTPENDQYMTQLTEAATVAGGIGIGDIARYSDQDLASIRSMLDETQAAFAVHAAETKEAQSACESAWGISEVQRVVGLHPDLLVHVTNPLPGDLAAIAEAGVPIACCTRTNALIADGIPPLDQFLAHGIPLCLGTDNVMLTAPDMFREMDWFSRVARALSGDAGAVSSREVLSIATLGGAEALGLEDEVGSLAPGKAACFIALDTRSKRLSGTRDIHAAIVHRAGLQDMCFVVSRGEVIADRRMA